MPPTIKTTAPIGVPAAALTVAVKITFDPAPEDHRAVGREWDAGGGNGLAASQPGASGAAVVGAGAPETVVPGSAGIRAARIGRGAVYVPIPSVAASLHDNIL
jgi:hypothetical protein